MPLNIDWQQILLHLLNFVILFAGLWLLLYKPVRNFMQKRNEEYENRDAEAERKQLMDFLALNKIGGVVMLSANKPYGEITRHVRSNGYPILDVTAGPLTGRPATEIGEMNYFRMPSSAMLKRSFAQVKIDGAENARVITFTFFDSKGNAGFSTSLKESDLYKFE